MNVWLSDALQGNDKIHILDASTWLQRSGDESHDPRLWYLAKIPYSPRATANAANEVKAAVRALLGQNRKLIILDLDDTLWGGTVGEDGWQHLRLGGHDAVGEAFVDFQRGLKALAKRGILLAISSKNSEDVALEALTKHPEMILRPGDFVTTRINWKDKAENILDIVSEINIGMDAVVFIDDDPTQRLRAKQALPALLVPDWPTNKLLYLQALERLTCFDAITTSREDQNRTAMYQQEKQRQSFMAGAPSRESWLLSLDLKVVVEKLSPDNLKRTVQLLNKTNQMNLTTRRVTEGELMSWAASPDHDMFVGRVTDCFGDYGLTAVISTAVSSTSATIVDFVLSCRVLDRGVEEAMLHCAAKAVRSKGADALIAPLVPTSRNAPCKQFFEERSGFEKIGDNLYSQRLASTPPRPAHLKLEFHLTPDANASPSAASVT